MTTGAAYDLAQAAGWKHGLSAKPDESKVAAVANVLAIKFDDHVTLPTPLRPLALTIPNLEV
jgi:hypothetical protein